MGMGVGTSVMWEECLEGCGGLRCGTHSLDRCVEEISLLPRLSTPFPQPSLERAMDYVTDTNCHL